MCEPATVMAIASAGAKYIEHENAVADYDATVVNNYNNRVNAVRSRDLSISQAKLKNEQERGVITDKKFANAIASLRNTEAFKTAAGEDNIVGRSIDQALNIRIADGLRNDTKLSTQASMIDQQSKMDALEIQARLEGRLAQIVDPNPPSVQEAIIGMATSGFQGANSVPEGTTWAQVFS
jgi:hypothetical protein